MDIRKATIADREAIFKIWLSCFSDDETYINNYLKYCFPHTITLLLGEKEQGDVSVISILPSYFIHNSITYTGGYLYGVGTLPEFRGRSYSSLLLKEGLELIEKEGYDYFLVKPATESLFSLYRRLGFNKDLFNKNTIIRPNKSHLEKRSIEDLSATDSALFHSMREDKLFNKSFLWPNEVLSYTIREITGRGGFLLFDKLTGHYCAGYTSENNAYLQILETSIDLIEFEKVFGNELMSRYPDIMTWEIEGHSSERDQVDQKLSALIMDIRPGVSSLCSQYNLSLPME